MQYRRNEINRMKGYFTAETCKRKAKSKTLSKCIATIILVTLNWFYQEQVVVFLFF